MRWAWLLFAIARAAAADTVPVKVTEVAGGVAYITPGRAAGIVRGTKVKLRGETFDVIEVTEKTGAVKLATTRLAIGDAGTAVVTPGATQAVAKLVAPRPAEAFAAQWPEPTLPASTQRPEPVPLGSGRARGRSRVTLIGNAYAAGGRGGGDASAEARVIASFELMTEPPLGADVDASARAFRTIDSGTRIPLFVRAAQLRYGDASDPRLAFGRLRYAASSLGMLDGGRASLRFGTLELAAFGGVVPDPLGGKPDIHASRFGGELGYDDPEASWQPRVAVTAYGSTWRGALDERRASVVASANRGSVWLDGWAEASQFKPTNPWQAQLVELTGAGGAVQFRSGGMHAGVDGVFQRPERSLRLDAYLPPDWLCTRAPQVGDVAETCSTGDYRASASASVGHRTSRWALDAVGSVGRSHGIFRGLDSSGYVRGEVYVRELRFHASGSGGRTSFASWTAGEIGGGFAPSPRLDVSGGYRLELLDYVASTGPLFLHSLVADAHYAARRDLELATSWLITAGADSRTALGVLATVVWRPLR